MKPLSLALTKEDFEKIILKQRQQQAATYGLTLEEWDKAILNGTTVTSSILPPLSF